MRVKRITRSGVVLECEIFSVADNTKNIRAAEPKATEVKTPEEREEYNNKKALKRMVRNVNASFNHHAYYVTLTFDDIHLPQDFVLAKKYRNNYIRRISRNYPYARIIAVMGRGRYSGRIHFHMIISGIPERIISEKWTYGTITRIEPLRRHNYYDGVDHGEDYTALATYLFNHWSPEQPGKNRYFQSKTVRGPVQEKPRIIKKHYDADKPPKTPEGYKPVGVRESRYYGAGYICFKYVLIPEDDNEP